LIKTYTILVGLLFLFLTNYTFANEKFLKLKGNVVDETTKTIISTVKLKIVLDDLDSTILNIDKGDFDLWLPANRKAKIYFIADNYIPLFIIIDASFIPQFAYKNKQTLELTIPLSKTEDYKTKGKPYCIANFKASENKFIITYSKNVEKKTSNTNFKEPFPAPVDTYKKAKPSNHNIETTKEINQEKAKKSSPYSIIVQGILFADMNYCIFNERITKANEYLSILTSIDKGEWGDIKPFDAPEYGTIVMRTLNREKSVDTLFALATWIETSRLLYHSFTSDSKIIMHHKKLVNLFKTYKGVDLTEEQKVFYNSVKNLIPTIKDLEEKFMDHMRNKLPFNMQEDETFIKLNSDIFSIYQSIIS
jgi:hypothetical protein